mgnify:CR=1 FL=1
MGEASFTSSPSVSYSLRFKMDKNNAPGTWQSHLLSGNNLQQKRLGEPFVQSEYQFALDWDHMVQLAGEKGRFICVEKPLIYYRVHEGATTNACIKDNRRAREEAEMFARFWPKAVVKLIMKGYSSAYKEYE